MWSREQEKNTGYTEVIKASIKSSEIKTFELVNCPIILVWVRFGSIAELDRTKPWIVFDLVETGYFHMCWIETSTFPSAYHGHLIIVDGRKFNFGG